MLIIPITFSFFSSSSFQIFEDKKRERNALECVFLCQILPQRISDCIFTLNLPQIIIHFGRVSFCECLNKKMMKKKNEEKNTIRHKQKKGGVQSRYCVTNCNRYLVWITITQHNYVQRSQNASKQENVSNDTLKFEIFILFISPIHGEFDT